MARIVGNNLKNRLVGTSLDDFIFGLGADDVLLGNGGNDTIDGGTGNDTADGGTGNDTIFGRLGNDRLIGGIGNDKLFGDDGLDMLLGGTGNDTVSGGAGADTLSGDDGIDTLRGGLGNDTLIGGSGNDTLFGEDNDDTLRGQLGNDLLSGGNGNDRLFGDEGNDTFFGGAGADFFSGGAGSDWVKYGYQLSDHIIVDLSSNPLSSLGGDATGDTFLNIENIEGTNHVSGDTIIGSAVANTILGLGGDDSIQGRGGADFLSGGDGDDSIYPGDPSAAGVLGDGAADIVDGGNGEDTVLYLGTTADVIVNLETGTGGGAAAGDKYISIENVQGGSGNDTLTVTRGGRAYGDAGADTLSGDSNGTTREILTGAGGIDKFVLHFFSASSHAADVITDFGLFETLQISKADFGLDANFTITAANIVNAQGTITGNAAVPQFIYEQLTNTLYFDLDGSGNAGAPIAIAELQSYTLNLVASNFDIIA